MRKSLKATRMSLSEYAYINARIGGMKSRLLSRDKIRAVAEARDISEAASMLKGTPYAEYMETGAAPGVLSIEIGLKKSLHGDYVKIINSMNGSPMKFIIAYAKRFEINVIKSLIKMKSTRSELGEYLIPFGEITQERIDKFLARESLGSALEELKGTSYYDVLRQVMREEKRKEEEKKEEVKQSTEETERNLTAALDAYYFDELWKMEKNLSGKDRGLIESFLGFEIDLTNLLTAVRLRGLKAEHEKYFIEGGKKVDFKMFKKICMIEDISRLEQSVPRAYAELVHEALENYNMTKSMVSFEVVFKKLKIKESRKIFLGERFHIGTILAYLNLKENEISNLIKIIKMKDELFTAREIENFLVAA